MNYSELEALLARAVESFLASTGQAHKVTQLQRDLTTECMTATFTEIGMSELAAKARAYDELLARVEAAPTGRVPKSKVGDLLLFPVSHDFAGKRVRLLAVEEPGNG